MRLYEWSDVMRSLANYKYCAVLILSSHIPVLVPLQELADVRMCLSLGLDEHAGVLPSDEGVYLGLG